MGYFFAILQNLGMANFVKIHIADDVFLGQQYSIVELLKHVAHLRI